MQWAYGTKGECYLLWHCGFHSVLCVVFTQFIVCVSPIHKPGPVERQSGRYFGTQHYLFRRSKTPLWCHAMSKLRAPLTHPLYSDMQLEGVFEYKASVIAKRFSTFQLLRSHPQRCRENTPDVRICLNSKNNKKWVSVPPESSARVVQIWFPSIRSPG